MGKIVSLLDTLHDNNVKRISKQILETFGTTAVSTDIAERLSQPHPSLNNWFIIKFVINRHFPSPSLCHVSDLDSIELEVIRQLLLAMRYPVSASRPAKGYKMRD